MSEKGLSGEDEKFQGTGHAATELVIRGRVESVFYLSHLGVSQEEVQKKPQLGTTQ
jgi:hypothetical protein